MKNILDKLKGSSGDFILAVIAIVLLNLVSSNAFFRVDLTEQKSFSISEASKTVVKNLGSNLSVNVFFSDDLPAPYNGVEQYLRDLLSEYIFSGNKYFNYKFSKN